MNADPAEVYSFRDFDGLPGLMLTYVGLTPPAGDPESIHACDAPVERGPREQTGRSFVRNGALTPEHEALSRAMKERGVSYRALTARLGVTEKGFYYRIRHRSSNWQTDYRDAALAFGRPDLLRFVQGPEVAS